MLSEMKFEESSLRGYLVKCLEPLTEADPVILADYVLALLKKDKPTKELQELCTANLEDFLGHGSKSFTAKLFQALEDGSIVRADRNSDVIKKLEPPSQPPITVETPQVKASSPKEENLSTSSEPSSDPEDKEVSDDDDDDRNHKHRRREARPNSFEIDNDIQEQIIRRPNKKRNKPYDNGQQSSEPQKEYNPTSEREISLKFDKRHYGSAPLMQGPLDLSSRTRLSHAFRTDPSPRFDLPTSIGRSSIGRGRGRSIAPWSQHDSRFSPLDTLDFASQIGSQGPGHPSLFVGSGLPSGASPQAAPWGGFSFISGMPNRILDPLHPLGLQGTLRSTITPPLNLGLPRQRCRDFEERGFCLRGDMCPMEHGLNRIVVEDVQSLSQFNLPVSIPSSHSLGIQAGAGPLPPVPPPSNLLTNSKATPSSKSSKPAVVENEVKLNGVSSTSVGGDTDVYDPDQPLWNSDRPETSTAPLNLPSPNNEDDPLWDADPSVRQSFGLSDCIESEHSSRHIGSQTTNSSVWGRIGSGNKSETGSKINNKMKEDHVEAMPNTRVSNVEIGLKATIMQPVPNSRPDTARMSGRAYQKASRTLYVNGVPLKNNRREALLSHFQKFGKVIDIYIPLNSEKAFVQFSKREEAEAALKAPDAVMGNRFIKLFWANRDTIPDEGQGSGHPKSVQSRSVMATFVQSHPSISDGGKENFSLSAQKRSNLPTIEASVPITGPPKGLITNGPKAAPPVPKKLESLELLKEELRRKQEKLAQKRNDFRRQLDKFEKEAMSVKKGDIVSEQAVKRHKVDEGDEGTKASTPRKANVGTVGASQEADKTLEKSNSEEVFVSPSSKTNSTILQQSPRNVKYTSCMPAPLANRFKLDNRTTSFRILPPLPAALANVAVLKDHFSSFGAISSVVLEDPEAHLDSEDSKSSQNSSACITFKTRSHAERAYQTGKCWEGHSLEFVWLTVSPNSSMDCCIQETSSSSTPKAAPSADTEADPVTSGSSASEIAGARNEESTMDGEGTNCAPISVPMSPVRISTAMSSCEKCLSESEVCMVEDSVNAGITQ